MEVLDGSRRRLDRSAQTDDLDALVALAALHPEAEGFEDWLRLSLRHPGSGGGVVLSTIHRVKGREWPHVVLHEVTDGLFPHRLAADVEEERRVFHVGLTRCSVSVHIVAGDPPSEFVDELTGEASRDPRRSGGPREEAWTLGRPGARQLDGEPGRALEGYGKEPLGGDGRRGGERRGIDSRWGGERQGSDSRSGDGRRGGERRRTAARQRAGASGPTGRARDRGAERIDEIPQEAVERVRRALRSWRSAQAARESKPAFVFLHDRTVEALAERAPTTMVALSRVPGIGPAKLEAYGDELLALIAEAVAGSQG
jgi:DNA helicase-2/ATP-dependent DNA helicase PcrA